MGIEPIEYTAGPLAGDSDRMTFCCIYTSRYPPHGFSFLSPWFRNPLLWVRISIAQSFFRNRDLPAIGFSLTLHTLLNRTLLGFFRNRDLHAVAFSTTLGRLFYAREGI